MWRRRYPVRLADIDGLGHVTAAAYFVLFEETRAAMMMEATGDEYPIYVAASQSIEYLREVRLSDEEVTVELVVERIGTSSLDLSELLLTDGKEIHARARATVVMWNVETRRPRPISPAERRLFESLMPQGTGWDKASAS